jgi:hypothetical protein
MKKNLLLFACLLFTICGFAQVKTIVISDTTVCPKSTLTTDISGQYTTVSWQKNLDLSCTTCLNPSLVVNKPTTIKGYALNKNGQYDTLVIKAKPYKINVGPDRKVCLNNTFKFFPIENYKGATFKWLPQNNLSCYDCANPSYQANSAGQIEYLVAMTVGTCVVKDTVKVIIVPELAPKFKLTDITKVCRDSTIRLGDTSNDPTNIYKWTAAGTSFMSNVPNPEVTLSKTVTFKVEVTTPKCTFPVQDSVKINVAQLFDVKLENTTICEGQSIQLCKDNKPLPDHEYKWSSNINSNDSLNLNIVVSPVKSTIYTLTAYNGCYLIKTANIKVIDVPDFELTASKLEICRGESVTLNIVGPDKFGKVIWVNNVPLCNNCLKQTVQPDTTTTYSVVVYSENGDCNIVKKVKVVVKDSPKIPITCNKTTICQGEFTQLNIPLSTENGYKWSGDKKSCDNCPNPFVNPDSTTTYVLTGKANGTGCKSVSTIKITVDEFPKVRTSVIADICNGKPDSVKLLDFPNTSWKYDWKVNGKTVSTNPNLKVRPLTPTTFYYTINNGTVGFYNAELSVSKDTLVCKGAKLILKASVKGDQSGKFYWTPGNFEGSVYTIANPQTSTTYQVRYDFNGKCPQYKSITAKVRFDSLSLAITPNKDFYLFPEGKLFQIKADVYPVAGYKTIDWYECKSIFTDVSKFDTTYLSRELGSKIAVKPTCVWNGEVRNNPKYIYIARVKFNDGCVQNISTEALQPECTDVKIPLAIAPESSDIDNRVFNIFVKGNESITLENIKIYNRWGQQIYSGKEPWNGHFQNNLSEDSVPTDVYMYRIAIRYGDGFLEYKSGDVTVLK